MHSRLTRIVAVAAVAIISFSPQLRAQSIRPPAGAPTIIRGCELVLHARNSGTDVITVDLAASEAQEGSKPWGTVTRSAFNQASAMTFTLPAGAPSTRHAFTTWINCDEKQRYKFSVKRGTKPTVSIEFPGAGAYTTDKSMRLGDLAGPP